MGSGKTGACVCWQHAAVAESAKALLDAAQDVPCELLAKVLKCLLLQLKRQDQQNRQSEQVKVRPPSGERGRCVRLIHLCL